MVIAALTFLAVLALVLVPYVALVLWPERQDKSALRTRLERIKPVRAPTGLTLAEPEARLSQIDALNTVLERAPAVASPLQRLLHQSGLGVSVGAVVLLCAITALLVYLAASYAVGRPAAIGLAGLATLLPYVGVRYARERQFARFEEQFPEAVELLARSLRAGHALPVGLRVVAEEMPAPLSTEFKLLHDRHSFGMPLPEALLGLAERVPLVDTRFFVTAVLTQREAGGNLAEVLDNLSSVMRDRFKVKRQIRVVSAHGRMTAWVLTMMPPVLAAILYAMSPQFMRVLVDDPMGVRLVLFAVTMQVVGTIIISRLVKVDY
jgi:tight adherence protein B